MLAALGVLVALGTWQLERKAWKEELIAELEAKLAATPTDLPPRERWQRLDAATRRVPPRRVSGRVSARRGGAGLFPGSSLRPDATGPGYWVFSPARLTGGSIVVVNRGFVPEGRQDPKTRTEGQPSGVVDIVGVMRWPEPRGQFTPRGRAREGTVVRARSGRDGRSRRTGATSRRSTSIRRRRRRRADCRRRPAEGEPAEQPPAICGNMVWAGAGDPDRRRMVFRGARGGAERR